MINYFIFVSAFTHLKQAVLLAALDEARDSIVDGDWLHASD